MKTQTLLVLIFFLFTIGTFPLYAQMKVSGIVLSSEDNQPVVGASVTVEGTALGMVTDSNGHFLLIDIPQSAKRIKVSFIGMKSVEVPIKPELKVFLEWDEQIIDELMVVAYGIAKKTSFTGSAQTITPERFYERPISNFTKILEGNVAGLQSTSGSGQPGKESSVIIHGMGSIKASMNPLYVVDGIPYGGLISAINPADIASLTVLKDAAAGALYGARGANGVVMINTNRKEKEGVSVELKASWGVSSRAIPSYELMDEKAYLETVFQSYKNENIAKGLPFLKAGEEALSAMSGKTKGILGVNQQYNPYNYPIEKLIDPITGKMRNDAVLKNTDKWMDELLVKNPLRQEYVLGVYGNKEGTSYQFSLGYLNEKGVLKTTWLERFTGRVQIDTEAKEWLKLGMGANFAKNDSRITDSEGGSSLTNAFFSAMSIPDIYPAYEYDKNGKVKLDDEENKIFDMGINRPSGASPNFNTIATLLYDKYTTQNNSLGGRAYLDLGNWKSGSLKGLKFSLNFGFDYNNMAALTYQNPYYGAGSSVSGAALKSVSRTLSYTFNQLLQWNRTFEKHHLDILVGHEFYLYNYDYQSGTKTGFPFGGLYEQSVASSISAATSFKDKYAVESFLTRVNYGFDNTYYFSASYRTDGSSRFNKEYRWGNFWSIGANWRVSEETFLKEAYWLDNLSIKASYGVQGNDNMLNQSGEPIWYAWQAFYNLAYSNNDMPGAVITSLENTNLRWEQNKNLNVGIETKLIDRITASVEWYYRKTEDMLMDYPMASSLGFDNYLKNIGSMQNLGVDIVLSGMVINNRDFKWNLSFIGSTINNKVLRLSDKPEIIDGIKIIREGEPLNSFYTSLAAGVDPTTGSQLYWVWDTDKQGVKGEKYISSDVNKATACKEITGNRTPKLYGSVGSWLSYKGFDLNVLCTYSIGGRIYDGVYSDYMYTRYLGINSHVNRSRAWKNPGDMTDIPKVEIGKTYPVTDNDLINASYFAFKNVTLGYTLPASLIKKSGIQSIRLNVSGENLCLLNHLKGMDNQYDFYGKTAYSYVPARTISVGIELKF